MSKDDDSIYQGINLFPRANGKTLHMDLEVGQISNRIITVGTEERARTIAKNFDATHPITEIASSRGFLTINGIYKNIPVSVVAIGMGISMMDFFVREARACVSGPMIIVRFGTCGCISTLYQPGSVIVSTLGSCLLSFSYSSYRNGSAFPYDLSPPAPSNQQLSDLLITHLSSSSPSLSVGRGLNITCDSFYSSQDRHYPAFDDRNDGLIDRVVSMQPDAVTMEMESFQLFMLANLCAKDYEIKASAAVIAVGNRKTSQVAREVDYQNAVSLGAVAILDAIVEMN